MPAQPGAYWSTTPQGFAVELDRATGRWLRVRFAAVMSRGGSSLPFEVVAPGDALRAALESNETFLVAADPAPFSGLAGRVPIANWGFGLSPAGGSVLIFKFRHGRLKDIAADTNRWTAPDSFSNGSPYGDAAGLAEWLCAYLAAAQARWECGGAALDHFANVVASDPGWTGIVALTFRSTRPMTSPRSLQPSRPAWMWRIAAHITSASMSRPS